MRSPPLHYFLSEWLEPWWLTQLRFPHCFSMLLKAYALWLLVPMKPSCVFHTGLVGVSSCCSPGCSGPVASSETPLPTFLIMLSYGNCLGCQRSWEMFSHCLFNPLFSPQQWRVLKRRLQDSEQGIVILLISCCWAPLCKSLRQWFSLHPQ